MLGWTVCVEHKGAHGMAYGACVRVGREVPRPFTFKAGVCLDCGLSLDLRIENRTGIVTRLEAGTDTRHWHAPAPRVDLDQGALAGAIVAASRATREQRRGETHTRPAAVMDAPPERPDDQPLDLGVSVKVWTDDDGDPRTGA